MGLQLPSVEGRASSRPAGLWRDALRSVLPCSWPRRSVALHRGRLRRVVEGRASSRPAGLWRDALRRVLPCSRPRRSVALHRTDRHATPATRHATLATYCSCKRYVRAAARSAVNSIPHRALPPPRKKSANPPTFSDGTGREMYHKSMEGPARADARDCGLRIADCGLAIADCGLRIGQFGTGCSTAEGAENAEMLANCHGLRTLVICH